MEGDLQVQKQDNPIENNPNTEDNQYYGIFDESESELSQDAKNFLKKYPTIKEAMEISFDLKKDFVKSYYAAEKSYEEKLEEMLSNSELIIEEELEKTTDPEKLSQKFFWALITLAKGRKLDELLEVIKQFYIARRKTVKDIEFTDPKILHITNLSFQIMQTELPEIICSEIESELKSRDLKPERIMPVVSQIMMTDISQFIDIERLFILKTVSENKDKEIKIEDIRNYICYSLGLSHKLVSGKFGPEAMVMLPHILSDILFNKTGYEGEEIVCKVEEYLKEDKLDEDLINLIIREAYAVEQGKEKSMSMFQSQMMELENKFAQTSLTPNPPTTNLKELENEPVEKNEQNGNYKPTPTNLNDVDKQMEMMPQMGMDGMMPQMGMGGMMPQMGMDGMMPPMGMGGMMPQMGMDGMMPQMGMGENMFNPMMGYPAPANMNGMPSKFDEKYFKEVQALEDTFFSQLPPKYLEALKRELQYMHEIKQEMEKQRFQQHNEQMNMEKTKKKKLKKNKK